MDPSTPSTPSPPTIDTTTLPPTPEELLEAQMKAWRKAHHEALVLDSRMSIPYGARLPLCTSISFLCGMALGISHGSQAASLRFRAENAHRLPTSPTGWYLYHKSKNYNTGLGGVKEGLRMGGRIAFWTAGLLAIEDMCDRWRGKKDVVNTVVASLSVAGGFSLWSEFYFYWILFIFGFGFWSCACACDCVRGSCDFDMNQWIIAPMVFSDVFANSSLWVRRGLANVNGKRQKADDKWSILTPLLFPDRFPITTAARTARTGLAFGIGYGLLQDAVGYARGRRLGYIDFLTGGTTGRRGGKKEGEDLGQRDVEKTTI